ncbi:hypothetical protein ACVWWO_003455 [Bradyrhizobium sp. F1.13.1]
MLCGSRAGDRSHRLVVREIHGIPYEDYSERTPMRVTWPPDYIASMLDRAAAEGLSVVKVHSHPGGYAAVSLCAKANVYVVLPKDWRGDAILQDIHTSMPGLKQVEWDFEPDGPKVYAPGNNSVAQAVIEPEQGDRRDAALVRPHATVNDATAIRQTEGRPREGDQQRCDGAA